MLIKVKLGGMSKHPGKQWHNSVLAKGTLLRLIQLQAFVLALSAFDNRRFVRGGTYLFGIVL